MKDPFVRYTERPYGCACYDCGLPYENFPGDMVIQDELWELISPSIYSQAGLLCPNCMCARLMKLPRMCSVNVTVNVGKSIHGKNDK